jgi:Mg-chelatase subunit ChlD
MNWDVNVSETPSKGGSMITAALANAAGLAAQELQMPERILAITAAELNEQPNEDLPEEFAVQTIRRIDTRSEAQQIWDATEHSSEFHKSMAELEARVTLIGALP